MTISREQLLIPTGSTTGATVTMSAFVMNGLDQVGFTEKPIPTPGPMDAIVRTTRALICTSDSHTVHGAIGPRENLTLGHEAVGIVYEAGAEVKSFKPGD